MVTPKRVAFWGLESATLPRLRSRVRVPFSAQEVLFEGPFLLDSRPVSVLPSEPGGGCAPHGSSADLRPSVRGTRRFRDLSRTNPTNDKKRGAESSSLRFVRAVRRIARDVRSDSDPIKGVRRLPRRGAVGRIFVFRSSPCGCRQSAVPSCRRGAGLPYTGDRRGFSRTASCRVWRRIRLPGVFRGDRILRLHGIAETCGRRRAEDADASYL